MIKSLKMTLRLIFIVLFIGVSTEQTLAATPTGVSISTRQILLDTGGGGGEGAALPGIKWTYGTTADGTPFMFWTWSTN